MGRKSNLDMIATGIIIITMLFFIYRYHTYVDIDSTVVNTLFTLLPRFLIVVACIYVTVEGGDIGRLGGSLGVGIGLCFLLNTANSEGLITSEMLSGLTIPQLQIWTMIIATIMGSIIYATS